MADPIIGEVSIWPITFTPKGWAICNGQLLAVSLHSSLFSIIGATYGGDGRTSFALPNLSGRIPIHCGQGPGLTARPLGHGGGVPLVSLTEAELPGHSHPLYADNGASQYSYPSKGLMMAALVAPEGESSPSDPPPSGSSPTGAKSSGLQNAYTDDLNEKLVVPMSDLALSSTGGNVSHENRQPFLPMRFDIALTGQYPSMN